MFKEYPLKYVTFKKDLQKEKKFTMLKNIYYNV